jgi:mannose-1-phosphate guanylyltransferase/mannose-6-phosphate isomerase
MLRPVILSGGSGTRLWPVSREQYPKQLLSLAGGGGTMLQATLGRLEGLTGLGAPLVVCNAAHRFLVAEQLRHSGSAIAAATPQILLEPVGRNTAAAIALAAHAALADLAPGEGDDPILLVLPADHVIADPAAFRAAVSVAHAAAREGHLVTFGVTPTHPETGYGYLVEGEAVEADAGAIGAGAGAGAVSRVRRIARFVEKPPLAAAERLLATGGCYWNSGMFVFGARRYLDELARHAPDIAECCARAWASAERDLDFVRIGAEVFGQCRSESIDYAVMEKTAAAVLVPLSAGWSDVGSWASLHEALERDTAGNTLRGDVLAEATSDSLVIAESRLVATVGLAGHVVVETKDAVLVAPKDRVQDVKAVVARLKSLGRAEHALHREVHRPWGSYDGIERGEGFQVKRLSIKPGASISLQLHHRRAEHWVVVAGSARITLGERVFTLNANESTYIPIGTRHRLENPGSEPVIIVEVQTGDYLGEDDIVRFEDRYGRIEGQT